MYPGTFRVGTKPCVCSYKKHEKFIFQCFCTSRHRARARDRDEAKQNRGSQHGWTAETRREPATERKQSGMEGRSTAGWENRARARDRDGAKRNRGSQHGWTGGRGREPATEMEQSGIEVRCTAGWQNRARLTRKAPGHRI